MDTSDPDITFDANGVCNHCTHASVKLSQPPYSLDEKQKKKALQELVAAIDMAGKGRPYNCIIGLSGGIDSTYVAYLVKELGLRPLAVHFDNGWNSELSVHNIENTCTSLGIHLYTYVVNWEEFKDLQLSFLRSSTPDAEIPSDHGINAILFHVAAKQGVKYILNGLNSAGESIMPRAWSQGHQDWKYIKSVHRQFGRKALKTFPRYSILDLIRFHYINKIKVVGILDYIDYDKDAVKQEMADKVGWRNYGRKHTESNYTRIYQEYILPTKFDVDKRRAHLSSLIMAGQVTREAAISELATPLIPTADVIEEDIRYLVNKFDISRDDWDSILASPPKSIHDYPNYSDSWYFSIGKQLHKKFSSRK